MDSALNGGERIIYFFIGGERGSVYTVKRDWLWLNGCSCIYSTIKRYSMHVLSTCMCAGWKAGYSHLLWSVFRCVFMYHTILSSILHLFMCGSTCICLCSQDMQLCECMCEHVLPPSCPRLRRTISCLAPMLPSMASSSLAFMSLDFLKVRLFIRSNAFFPCMVNTTWALYPWGTGWGGRTENTAGEVIGSTALSKQSRLVV